MNSSGLDHGKRSDLIKTMNKAVHHRPKTTQNQDKNRRKHCRTGIRPSSESHGNNTMNWINNRTSIFEQNKFLPPYENLVFNDSMCNTNIKNKSIWT